MKDKALYLEKLREIFKKESFWNRSYMARVVNVSINCMHNLLSLSCDDDKVADRTMIKIKEFVDKYEKEKNV